MSVGQLQIQVDSSMAERGLKAMADRVKQLENELAKSAETTSENGNKWTELVSKLTLAKTAFSSITAVFDKFQQSAKERGVLFSQFGENADIGAAKLMKYSAAVDYMINANALMRSSNALVNGDLKVSEDRFESVTKAAVEFARRSGEDVNTVLKTLTDSINAGTTRGLKPFGVQLDDTGTKAQKSERILAELHKRFKDIKITVGDAAEDMDKFKNKTKIMELVGGDAIERMVRKYQSMKLASAEWVADAFNVSTVQLYAQKMNEANDKILAGDKQVSEEFNKQIELQNKLIDIGRDSANNGQRRREIADEMVTSLDNQAKILEKSYDRQKLIADYAQQTGEDYVEHKKRLERIKTSLEAVRKKQKEWTDEAVRTGGVIGKIFNFSIDAIKKAANATGKVVENIDKEAKARKKVAKIQRQLSEDEIFKIKLKQLEQGKYIEFTAEEYKKLAKIEAERAGKDLSAIKNRYSEFKNYQSKQLDDLQLNYDISGVLGLRKIKLEQEYNKEIEKGSRADQDKIIRIYNELSAIKEKTKWQKEFKEAMQVDELKLNYQQFIDDQRLLNDIQRETINLQIALKDTDPLKAQEAQARLMALKQQGEAIGQFNLKMKEWEQSSYGALGAVKNIWQASGDAILMTDAQLRKAGKTRAQVIKQAVQAQILALGKQNLFEGGTNLAKGFAATAMGNPAAAGFFKAAGIHFAVAAAAGIGNSLFGGGGGGKQEDKAKTAPTTNVSTTNQQSSTTIIQVQNSMLFGSVDELARGVDNVLKDAGRRGQI